jgi:hypothetical protein
MWRVARFAVRCGQATLPTSPTLLPVVKRMRERFRIREITIVADRGMVSQATLEAFENSDPPVRYVVGVRMRRQKEVSISVLGSRAHWFESVPERSKAKGPAPLKVKEVWVEDRCYVVCLNEERSRTLFVQLNRLLPRRRQLSFGQKVSRIRRKVKYFLLTEPRGRWSSLVYCGLVCCGN